MGKEIRVGIIGLGNVPSGLIQGIEFYRRHPDRRMPSIVDKSGYDIRNIKISCAFDIDKRKIGKDIKDAIYVYPNLVKWINIPKSGVIVKQGPRFDSVGKYVKGNLEIVKEQSVGRLEKEILKEIYNTETEVLVNCLPVGSQKATEFWVRIALKTKCAFINAIPVFIASNKAWEKRFASARVPIIGDDIKGVLGATVIHRNIANLIDSRGAKLVNTYQLNIGGNTDFKNMLERERLVSKKISKTESVQSQLTHPLNAKDIHIGPSDFVEFLGNTKIAHMYFYGSIWADAPYKIYITIEVNDKANAAGILVDAIRLAKVAIDRKIGGAILAPSAYLMKHPPVQFSDTEARRMLEYFIYRKDPEKDHGNNYDAKKQST